MTKFILRRAIEAQLPEAVVWRRGKEHLGWAFTAAVMKAAPRKAPPELLRPYVDYDRAHSWRDAPAGSERFADWLSCLYLANWFETALGSAA